ncbi:MAG: signal peptidase I [Bacilli bacterium]|nr:signal peptidase I [Bacilli bacterium]
MSKGIHRLFDIIFIAIIVILLGYFALRVTNKVEIYNVKTGSMEAKIHVGDYILILKKSRYDIGDVITFASNNSYVTHRIVRINGDKITTKGDANNTEDETISSSSIVGKVILSGGILNIIINYKYALAGIVLSLYLLSCYFESRKKEKSSLAESENKELKSQQPDVTEEDSDEIQEEVEEKKKETSKEKNTKKTKKKIEG